MLMNQTDSNSKSDPGAPLTGFWYPALLSSDVRPGAMKAQTLLGLPLVMCRDTRGGIAALRDICPHRAMPLSFGCFDGERIECSYHGWQFDMSGTCRHIPALVEGSPLNPEKIGVTAYPCRDQDGYVWVYVPDSQGIPNTMPDVPRLPVLSESYRLFHISTTLKCTIDNGIVGLMDPAHGPFVHQSLWWRSRDSIHEKAKAFEPIPNGFRMTAHAPSRNSGPYKLLGLSGPISTTIDFILPNLRLELVQAGRWWISTRATVTPISQEECRIDFCAAWNILPWLPFSKSLFRIFARIFLNQDRDVMERQSVGLKHSPPMMLLDDADTPAKWYFKLKAAHQAARRHGGPLEHPLKEPVTLRWRS
jgi:phenylpropionate dioxygenase-like ring-hydroxylating dioxygenase large terminal subunit